MRLIAKLFLVAAALLVLPSFISGITIESFKTAFIVAVFLGLVNLIIKPIILLVLLPINILTLGLFTFVVNALLFWGIASFVKGFYVTGFEPAFWGALVMSIVGVLVNMLLNPKED